MDDIQTIRRKNLQSLIDQQGLASLARQTGKPDRQLNDMVAKRKSFGEKVAREIETKLGLTLGWLDQPQAGSLKVEEPTTPYGILPAAPPQWPFEFVDENEYLELQPDGKEWVQKRMSADILEARAKFGTISQRQRGKVRDPHHEGTSRDRKQRA